MPQSLGMPLTYDYPRLIRDRTADLPLALGRTLTRVLVNVVEPEYNVLYLKLDDDWFTVHGQIGGEFLCFRRLVEPPTEEHEAGHWTGPFPRFDVFVGRRVEGARQIGDAWNGHGFELSFAGLPDQTLLVQALDERDCIRLGIGQYWSEA